MGKTKQCKYCRSEIDKKAKVCPVCQRKQNGKGCLIAAIIIFVIVVGGIIGIIAGVISATQGSSSNPGNITYSEYQQIENGMTYDEVVNIIGSSGTEMSSAGEGRFYTVMYMWYGNELTGSNANVTFQNGVVIGKAQFGLTDDSKEYKPSGESTENISSTEVSSVASSDDSDESKTPSSSKSEKSKPENKKKVPVYAKEETASIGGFDVTVLAVSATDTFSDDLNVFTADPGNIYVYTYVNIKNTGKTKNTFLPSKKTENEVVATLIYDNKTTYSTSTLKGYQKDLHDTILNPQESREDFIIFSVPQEILPIGDKSMTLNLSAGTDEIAFKLN